MGWCWLMDQTHPALSTLLNEIQGALDSKLYYLALAVCLSLADICAATECEPDKIWVKQDKYEAWCETNLIIKYKHLTARDCYRLRCGVLHQGNFGRPDDRYEQIIFVLPNTNFSGHEMKLVGAFTVGEIKISGPVLFLHVRWSRLSEQIFRVDRWNLCHG
jgi:hypothetical protein